MTSGPSQPGTAKNDEYAKGHAAQRPMPVRHQIYRLPEAHSNAEIHLTDENGLHYLFSLTRNQSRSSARQLAEVVSRMSDPK